MGRLDDGRSFFQELEQHMKVLSPTADLGLKRDRWLLVTIGSGAVLAFAPFHRIVGPGATLLIVMVGLALELGGFAIFTYRQGREMIPDFVDSRRKFAVELDEHFEKRQHALARLRNFPSTTRNVRLEYLQARLEVLRSRYLAIFGPVDRLGLLPVLVGFFVQVQAIRAVSLPAMLIGTFVVALYLMALWMSRYRFQLEGYIRLLRAADEELDEVVCPSNELQEQL